jgi:hypothetical protein
MTKDGSRTRDLPFGKADYGVLELCTGADSRLGQKKFFKGKCEVCRIDERINVTSPFGQKVCSDFSEAYGNQCFVWDSSPCTAGCQFYNLNKKHAKARKQRVEQRFLFECIHEAHLKIGRKVIKSGGQYIKEWPNTCTLWKDERVEQMKAEFGMEDSVVLGCKIGLTGWCPKLKGYYPVHKAWRLSSTSPRIPEAFVGTSTCEHEAHAQVQGGKFTKSTESYTDEMAHRAHRAFKWMHKDARIKTMIQSQINEHVRKIAKEKCLNVSKGEIRIVKYSKSDFDSNSVKTTMATEILNFTRDGKLDSCHDLEGIELDAKHIISCGTSVLIIVKPKAKEESESNDLPNDCTPKEFHEKFLQTLETNVCQCCEARNKQARNRRVSNIRKYNPGKGRNFL